MRLWILAASTAVLVARCSPEPPNEDQIVLDIAGKQVTLGEFERFVDSSLLQESPFLPGDIMAALFEQFLEEQVLLKAADDAGIPVDRARVEATLESLARIDVRGSESREARTAEGLRNQLRIEALLESEVLRDIHIDEEEVIAHFEANRAYYERPETMDVSQILVEEEELARKIHEDLLAEQASFEELARKHSVRPEAGHGGRLGGFARGELPPNFEEQLIDLKPGGISDVVATDFGFHIFRLNKREPSAPLELEEVEDAIRVDLLRQKSDAAVESYLSELKQRYDVIVHRENLSFAFLAGTAGGERGVALEDRE